MDSTTSPDTAVADDGRLARGRARIRELAVESEAERQAEQAALLADLGREPGHAERLLIEQAAHLAVRARRLRALGRGREADDVTRLLIRALAKLGVKPSQAQPESLEQYLARTAAPPSSASAARDESAGDGADYPDSDERTGGPRGGAAA
jgi:hypothetical protein